MSITSTSPIHSLPVRVQVKPSDFDCLSEKKIAETNEQSKSEALLINVIAIAYCLLRLGCMIEVIPQDLNILRFFIK